MGEAGHTLRALRAPACHVRLFSTWKPHAVAPGGSLRTEYGMTTRRDEAPRSGPRRALGEPPEGQCKKGANRWSVIRILTAPSVTYVDV